MAMAEKKNEFPAGVEADRRLLQFETWEDYLDSLIEIADLRNLRSIKSSRIIAALGYRALGDTLLEKEFYARRAVIKEIVYPTVRPYVLVSEGADVEDPFNRELAVRERANRVGILQTIIFIRHFTKGGFEISGYIDYAHRLGSENWSPFFKNNKMLWPRDNDLGYYHWRHGTVRSNMSRNYKPVMDPDRGLLFQNRHDHKIICPDPEQDPGQNTSKLRIFSPRYSQVEIYDHVIRCALMNATITASQTARMTSGRVRGIAYLKTGLLEIVVFPTLLALVPIDKLFVLTRNMLEFIVKYHLPQSKI